MHAFAYDRTRSFTAAVLLSLLGLVLHGCMLIVDADEYSTCTAGTEACKCMPGDTCNEGLECREPGLCVVPMTPTGNR